MLKYHIIQGEFSGSQLASLRHLPTLNGEAVEITEDAPGVARIVQASGDARIQVQDVRATNGITHVIDKVILPPSLQVNIAFYTT